MDRRLFVLAVGMFALGTDSFVVAAVLPGISHAFGVSIGAAGQMASIYSVTFALLSPPIAALAATIPRKRLLLCGGVIFVLANLGTVIAPTFGLALLSRIIAGVGAATFSPTATGAAVMLVRPEHRLRALGGGGGPYSLHGIGHTNRRRHWRAGRLALDHGICRRAWSLVGCRYCCFLVGSAAAAESHLGKTP